MQLEMTAGVRERVMRDQGSDVCELGLLGLQELTASGGIEKQIANGEGGAHR